MAEKLINRISDTVFIEPHPQVFLFHCDEIILKAGSIELKIPDFIQLTNIDTLAFEIRGEKMVFKKVKS